MIIATADLNDANPDLVRVCNLQFRSFGKKLEFAGPCFTVKVFEDHRKVRAVAETPGEGRVLVVDGGGSLRMGLMGDQMAELAMSNGWIGAVINGPVRDSRAIDALDFGVKALGTTARRSTDEIGGLTDLPVAFGGIEFRSGWWVYADVDAVVVSETELPPL
jgi:regulator of ribonuclease activity A